MSDRPERVEKERVSVTLTRPYLDGMDHQVKEGIHMERQSVIRAALRLYLGVHGIPPFRVPERPPEKGEEEAGGRG